MSNTSSQLQAIVEQNLKEWRVPGMAVGIMHGNTIETFGFGTASIETGFPVLPNTMMQIGSISKVFTATLAMTLVEDGMLELDTPIVKYLPGLRLQSEETRKTLTMRHLLTHTSGLFGDWFEDYGIGDDALSNAMQDTHTLRQIVPVGDVWSYCNSGFYIAGAVIERITEQTFEDVMRERVFKPIGMNRTTFFAHEAIVYPVAVGHTLDDDGNPKIARRYPLSRFVNAAGGIIADPADMLRFARMHLNGGEIGGTRVLSTESVAEMQHPEVKAAVIADYYGLGWALRDYSGTRLVGHGGSTNGFRAYLTIVPEHDFAIIMLTNGHRGDAVYKHVERWALDHYCSLSHTRPEPVRLSEETLERYTGWYEQQLHVIDITLDRGRLRLDVTDRTIIADEVQEVRQEPKYAVPVSKVDFMIEGGPDDGGHVDFILDEHGKPKYFRYHGRISEPVAR